MFKFRFGGQGSSSPMQPPTIETVRRRARHRLLGASVLVLAGVIGFPLLFESQPRPVPVDFEIDIPARNTAKSKTAAQDEAPQPSTRLDGLDESEELLRSAQAPAQAVPAPAPVIATPPPPAPVARSMVAPAAPAAPVAQAVAPAQPQTVKPWDKRPVVVDKPAETKVVASKPPAETKPAVDRKPVEPKPVEKPAERKPVEPKAAAAKAPDDAIRAMALLEGKSVPQDKPAGEDKSASKRHVVQVGAFVDPTLAQEARMKLERGGLPTYTQIGNTPDGPRTRVRLGPFATRDEAAKAAAKARALGLSASILTL